MEIRKEDGGRKPKVSFCGHYNGKMIMKCLPHTKVGSDSPSSIPLGQFRTPSHKDSKGKQLPVWPGQDRLSSTPLVPRFRQKF